MKYVNISKIKHYVKFECPFVVFLFRQAAHGRIFGSREG